MGGVIKALVNRSACIPVIRAWSSTTLMAPWPSVTRPSIKVCGCVVIGWGGRGH